MAAPNRPKQGPIKRWTELPEEPRPPLRKHKNAVGTLGKPIKLKANYYEVEVKDWHKQLVHYDVVIKQPGRDELDIGPSKSKKLEIFELFKESNKEFFTKYKLAYDGMKSAVSVGVIPQLKDGAIYKVFVERGIRKKNQYHVILKVVNKASLMELKSYLKAPINEAKEFPAIVFQLMEIMFRHTPSTKYLSIGQNSFFSRDMRDSFSISGDMVAQRGFFASLRPAAWKDGSLLLNIDVAHAVFYKEQPVLKFMEENRLVQKDNRGNPKPLDRSQIIKLKRKLNNLKVRVSHAQFPRTYKVIDVMEKGADKQMFKIEENKYQSVEGYFKEKYPRSPIRYPWLNVIRGAPDTKSVYLPIEYCHIAKGQKVSRQNVGSKETSSFLSFTARPPSERLRNINEIVRNKDITENDMMKNLELSFDSKPIELTGRVLPAPEVKMKNNSIVPQMGKWDVRDSKFFHSKDIECWAVLNYADRINKTEISDFVSEIIKLGQSRGMIIGQPDVTSKANLSKNPEIDLPYIKQRNKGLQLLMVILATKNADSPYAPVKRIGDRILNVPTQCVLAPNVSKVKNATVGNLLFKMNAKMGGINNTLVDRHLFVFDRPAMVMGADVNHPPASDKSGIPSIAAVVGSLDRYAYRYAVEVRPQESRKEMIEKLDEMTKSLLITFYKTNHGYKPERLIMYRDGVSESQFFEVLAFELRALRSACTTLENGYEPAITVIVVQKRHHTRFFPVREQDGIGRNKNVPPGTIVDTAVTHPTENDFFLCSHEGIQGTSKPTHYRVLWDDSDFTIDQLQMFSFAMCHLYARCARSVSIPTPAYYAHWAAYRGKVHLHELCNINNQNQPEHSYSKLLAAVNMNMQNEMNRKMYFL